MKISKKCQVSNWMGDRLRQYFGKLLIMMSFVFCLDLWTQFEYQARPNGRLLTHQSFVHMSCQCTECDYHVTQKGSLVIIKQKKLSINILSGGHPSNC